jgi:hypothetical protein
MLTAGQIHDLACAQDLIENADPEQNAALIIKALREYAVASSPMTDGDSIGQQQMRALARGLQAYAAELKREPQRQFDLKMAAELLEHLNRENPKMLFAKNWDEIEIDQSQLHSAVTDYLAKQYLRHPTIDWILLDMLVTRELVAWGLRVRYVGPILSWFLGQSHRRKRYLWAAMYDVWTFLAPPVVNPSMVRHLLVKTTDLGAGWDTPTWSVVDRAIAADPSVLLVEQRGFYPTKTRA